VSNGDHYNAAPIPDHPTRPDLAAPAFYWHPAISPSGMMFYTGTRFPDWRGNVFIGGLSSETLLRLAAVAADAGRALTGRTDRVAARHQDTKGGLRRSAELAPFGEPLEGERTATPCRRRSARRSCRVTAGPRPRSGSSIAYSTIQSVFRLLG
jgi:hypothetical protein